MASTYIEKRRGPRGMRYRAVLEWWESGKRRTRKETWTRYWKRAKAKSDELLSTAEDVRLGIKKPRQRHAWASLVDKWKASRSERAEKTRIDWDEPMISAAEEFWGNPDISEITRERCGDFREHLRAKMRTRNGKEDRKYSETTVKMRLQALKAILYYAKDALEWIDRNPMAGVEIPQGADSERVYTDSEYQAVMAVAEEDLKGPLIMAAKRGVRRQELVMMARQMLWKDEDGDLWIRMRKPTRFGIKSDLNIKTRRKGERDIHIPPEVLPYMVTSGEGQLFPDLTADKLRRLWQRARERAKLTLPARWHDWKHTAITKMLEQGFTLLDVQRLTGNTLDSLQRYAHIGARFQKHLAARVSYDSTPSSSPNDNAAPKRKGGAGKSSTRKAIGALGVEPRTSWSQTGRTEGASPTKNGIVRRCPTCGQPIETSLIMPNPTALE